MTEFGFFGSLSDEQTYLPAGFNAWRESDGELAIGELTEMDYFRIEGTDKYMRGIDVPPGFWECGDHEKQSEIVKKNVRHILQLFSTKVLVYPDRVEIKGQFLLRSCIRGRNRTPKLVWLSLPPLLRKERGKSFLERGFAPLRRPFRNS